MTQLDLAKETLVKAALAYHRAYWRSTDDDSPRLRRAREDFDSACMNYRELEKE